MSSSESEPLRPPPPKDQGGLLVVFGTLEILLGVGCAAMALFMLGAGIFGPLPGTNVTMLPLGALYFGVALAFVWLGIGAILAKRWARSLNLALSCLVLAAGVAGIFNVLLTGGMMGNAMQQTMEMPKQMVIAMQLFMVGTAGCTYIIIPGIGILVFGNPNVRATCERRHPQPAWTDGCPFPVLVLSVACALAPLSVIPLFLLITPAAPFFGVLIGGLAGALLNVAAVLTMVYLAWASYRRVRAAWWLAVGMIIAGSLTIAITVGRLGMLALYQHASLPKEQMQMMRRMYIHNDGNFVVLALVSGIAALGYLLYVRRYFFTATSDPKESLAGDADYAP